MIISHLALFVFSGAVVWFFGGRLVDSIDRIARRFKQSRFTAAFFILGLITSIGEMSVMVNATLDGVPQISAGNLSGASIVIFLFIIPFLAIRGGGLTLRHTLTPHRLAAALAAVVLPTVLLIDGTASIGDGLLCLAAYGVLIYFMKPTHAGDPSTPELPLVETKPFDKMLALFKDVFNVLGGGIAIFLAGNILVSETTFFSELLRVPGSFIGLLVLSIGTNVPELVIALRAVEKRRTDIAFGNYLGSALANTALFGILMIWSGGFAVIESAFLMTSVVIVVGLSAFYLFARSENMVSRSEGWFLGGLYAIFVVVQILLVCGIGTACSAL